MLQLLQPRLAQTVWRQACGQQTTLYSLKKKLRALFGRPAGHGPVHTNENHAVIIPRPKAGDNNTYSLLLLPGVGGAGIRGERLSDI